MTSAMAPAVALLLGSLGSVCIRPRQAFSEGAFAVEQLYSEASGSGESFPFFPTSFKWATATGDFTRQSYGVTDLLASPAMQVGVPARVPLTTQAVWIAPVFLALGASLAVLVALLVASFCHRRPDGAEPAIGATAPFGSHEEADHSKLWEHIQELEARMVNSESRLFAQNALDFASMRSLSTSSSESTRCSSGYSTPGSQACLRLKDSLGQHSIELKNLMEKRDSGRLRILRSDMASQRERFSERQLAVERQIQQLTQNISKIASQLDMLLSASDNAKAPLEAISIKAVEDCIAAKAGEHVLG
eukprot:CAMPEP_0170582534 /NCGR_PEP_ID=MMETSP0224-20130122/7637_1 /TAXON_ID=285029 /ORGANISM="Togula jolla, Strain CCCM 725" /LENGTH=303 /DNA_ID=CAMNT_0010905769 /DNA_START=48 /DNA_END=959 /DNA_ORIENTATION=-